MSATGVVNTGHDVPLVVAYGTSLQDHTGHVNTWQQERPGDLPSPPATPSLTQSQETPRNEGREVDASRGRTPIHYP